MVKPVNDGIYAKPMDLCYQKGTTKEEDLPVYMFMKENDVEIDAKGSKIVEFFGGKSIFITGATGFLGKLLIEKLLRACEDIETIYILIRPKKGKNAETRIDEMLNDVVFSKLAKLRPKFRHKIVGIKGDVSLPGLGLGEADRELIREKVNVIFHVAATVKFDEKIKLAVAINIKGTDEIITLGRECKHLESMVHVSTAFANCPYQEIDELFYKPPVDAQRMVELTNTHSDKELENMLPHLLGKWPNTYSFTKSIGEDMVKEKALGLPVCVYRPAIVVATYKEPLRSWIDNIYGPTGMLLGCGTGLIRTICAETHNNADIVPGDYVVNGLIAASYKTAIEKKKDTIPVYNYVSSPENPITWGHFMEWNQKYGIHVPTVRAIWYYSLVLITNWYLYLVAIMVLHYIPAILMDGVLLLIGKEPTMVKIYKKIHKFSNMVAYFSTRQWKFHNDNVKRLWMDLNEVDQKAFPFSMKDLDWDEHCQTQIMGVRTYVLKEDVRTLPAAKKKWNRLYMLHVTMKVVFGLILLRILYGVFSAWFL